ncbi:MAG: molybdopterin-dependent oxidoreductase [Deltaproteobacteria bacterium]|nr:molybdopterin-dependent oxidoreductase [Deltaproteobacteria bacterium]
MKPVSPGATRTFRTTCKVGACEPFCGLEVDVEAGVLVGVRPDRAHPVTSGYACIKGMQVPAYQNDPDRLLFPERRVRPDSGGAGTGDECTGTGAGAAGDDPARWERIGWDQAAAEIGTRLRAIRARHGARAIATYWGNAADSVAITLANTFCHSLGSPNSFNVLSLEYTDRGAVAQRMLGNENLILQPDVARARYALLIGTNPLVTQGVTLLQRRPRIAADLKAIQHAGGKVVVVDPRRTETARIADQHVAIRPGTDVFLLLAMLRRIVETRLYDRSFVERRCRGFDELAAALRALTPERAAEITTIAPATIQTMADEFAGAGAAFATTRVGVQTGWNTTVTEWAVQCLNAITGNVDRPGGVYFNPGAIDVPALIESFTKRRNQAPSRIGGYPQIFGGPPASVFAEDVLSDDPERIRALVVVAGNPVLTFPNTARVEAALRRLELLVCIDIYRSDTGAFAHYNLPAATAYEKGSFHFLTSTFEPYPYMEWKPKVVEARGQARSEWKIFKDLARATAVPFLNDPIVDAVVRVLGWAGIEVTEGLLFRYLLLGKGGLARLRRSPGGVKTGEIEWGRLLERGLKTHDGRIALAPPDFIAALSEVVASPPLPDAAFPLLLVSGARRAGGYNTWTHNLPELMKMLDGNWATVNPRDAARLGIGEGDAARIVTASGEIIIELRTSADVREGVVAVQQFWGHHYDSSTRTSRSRPGVNVNLVHDDRGLDRFTGMPVFNGRPCRIEPI